ncbi:MAG: TRAP transporter TatT component family protein [Candidatus Binatia bacterium]
MRPLTLTTWILALVLPGCGLVMGSASARLANNVSTAILSQNDIETVRDGAPAYLIMLDGLIAGDPESPALLLAGAQLYGAYGTAFVEEPARRRRLTERSLAYGRRALCAETKPVCKTVDGPYEPFAAAVAKTGSSDVAALYGFGSAWAGWIEAHSEDWAAVAEIPKVETLMQRVVTLDDAYDDGGAHLYLGVLSNLRPAALGGKPEEGKYHFERAIEISDGRNLMAKVLYARYYARNVFDRSLHDRLLTEVVEADPEAPGLTLSNTIAQTQARQLLDESNDYF